MRTADRIINHGDYIEINVQGLAAEVETVIRRHLDAQRSMTKDEIQAWCALPTNEEKSAWLDRRASDLEQCDR